MDDGTKAALRRNFDAVANEPGIWFYVAGNLGFSAQILEQHFVLDLTKESDHERIVRSSMVEGAMFMLRGCRMECLLKALLVASGIKLGEDGRYLPPGGRAHDLLFLAHAAGLTTMSAEQALLRHLSLFIVQGRYPIAKRSPEAFSVTADGSRRSTSWGEEDEREYKRLDQRLSAEVSRIIQEQSRA